MPKPTILGIHHITAIASDPQRILDFYTQVLGLRLVKLTVNFDDPGTYHFYFGDYRGTPGSILTFFPWPGMRRGSVGNGQVSASAFAVPADSLPFWEARLQEVGTPVEDAGERFGEPVLRCADPDGMPFELVGTLPWTCEHVWKDGPVPTENAIGGFHSATLCEEGYQQTAALLQDVMGLKLEAQQGERSRYSAGGGGPGAFIDLVCRPDGKTGALGAGTVHHIAWRTPDDEQQQMWRERLVRQGYNVTPVLDRSYFRSIYFREPGGVLFEIATDPPGFGLDEPVKRLGEKLKLPQWLEPQRAAIEKALPPLKR